MVNRPLLDNKNPSSLKGDTMKEVLKNPRGKLICVDLDGTLSKGEWWGNHHPDPQPRVQKINLVKQLYGQGAHIIIYTARQPKWYQETLAWLIKYGVPFHGIAMFVKPGADLYLDDKAIRPEEV